jgi:hypothetical protein
MLRKLIYSFTLKMAKKNLFGQLETAKIENYLSVRAEILREILKEKFLDLMEKVLSKMLRKSIFSLCPRNPPKLPLFGPLKTATI